MKNLSAIFVIILRLPFLIFGYLLKNKAALIICVVLVIGLAVWQTTKSKPASEEAAKIEVPYYQENAPAREKSPNVIQTIGPDRVYYVARFTDDGETITLAADGFYMYNKKKWEVGKLPLPLERGNFQNILIYKR